MAKISLKQVKELRDKTGVGVMEAKKALNQAAGDSQKAKELLKQWGAEKLAERGDKETEEGQVFAYIHAGGKLGALVALACETDFTARSEEFQKLGKEIAMQIASMGPKNSEELLNQAYIRNSSEKISDLIAGTAATVKEKIAVVSFERFSL